MGRNRHCGIGDYHERFLSMFFIREGQTSEACWPRATERGERVSTADVLARVRTADRIAHEPRTENWLEQEIGKGKRRRVGGRRVGGRVLEG